MGLGTALLIANLIVFTVILVVLVAYIGPILTEIRLTMSNVRQASDIARRRMNQLDDAIDTITSATRIFKRFKKIKERVAKWKKKKDSDEGINEED